tara:strand:- start:148 stop:723 length:576 start_codon:yes stop_codon:yes gene_type:complete
MLNKWLLASLLWLGVASAVVAESLYDEASYRPMVADKRASRVGDSLTVLIIENASAQTSAGTDSSRSVDLGATVSDTISEHRVSSGISGNRAGDASTARQGRLKGQLTVTVKEITENGRLRVGGEQLIVINGEQQKIGIEGYVRSEDVSSDNTILSVRLSDAKIEYTGEGDISDTQRKGIIAKALSWLGLL